MRRAVLAALGLLTLASAMGCASGAAGRARVAEQQQDYDRAVVEYTQALKERPEDKEARLALDRARVRASQHHFQRGRRLEAVGRYEEALLELQVAAELNPSNGDVEDLLRSTRLALRNKIAVSREGKTKLETLMEHARESGPIGLELPKDIKLPSSLVFRDASSRDVLTALARFANVNITFDPAFRETPITIEVRNTTFEDALSSVTSTTRTFFRVTAPRTVTIVPDTPAKRREYEEEIVRTFYLSNAELKETIDLLRIVVDARRVAGMPGTNAISIKDSPERIAAAGRVITAIDKARPEVVLEVELLEVNRSKLREYGLQIASPGDPPSAGINGTADVNRPNFTLRDLRELTASDVFLTGVPALYYRLLKSDTNTRTLANPQLRTTDGIAAQARFGERVPVPVTTFSPIATGGVPQQPITSFNYENIGVNIDITPRTHHNDDVSLTMKVEVSSISGTGFGGLPTFGTRFINTVLRLRDGETNVLAGLIRDEERVLLEGIPGLSDIPGLGKLFTRTRKEAQETDILLTLTPHIVRVLELSEADLRPFRVRSGPAAPLIDLPAPEPPPARDQPQPLQERPATPGTQQPIGPITPPVTPPAQEPPSQETPQDPTTTPPL
ncbi:MAG TPA: secretin N-terminal domain-containing protein [Vicinamibacterales bacterium]|jgi:general secretion pathway protein D|nr:secretin N-terminal domain-containing protein [Vicinamibacterales bacterium]